MGIYDSDLQYSEKTATMARAVGRRVAAIGGGTGLSSLLLGLKEYTENISAIVTVTDDGGGSGMLREEFNILPPGDIRNCILALANITPSMNSLLNHRFAAGSLEGQSFGNLFLLALVEIYGSFEVAVEKMNEYLAVTGKVIPVTTANAQLVATFESGKKVLGETAITKYKGSAQDNIVAMGIIPENAQALPGVICAIKEADVIVLGPGSLYTSLLPNLLVNGVREAIISSNALKIYVMNIMTQNGETENFTAIRHLEEVERYIGTDVIDICLANSEVISKRLLAKYAQQDAVQIMARKASFKGKKTKLVEAKMASRTGEFARHDPLRLSYNIMSVAASFKPRDNVLKAYDDFLLKKEL